MCDFEYNCLRKYRHKIEYDPLCSWFTYFLEIYIYFHHSTRKNNIKIPQKCPENHLWSRNVSTGYKLEYCSSFWKHKEMYIQTAWTWADMSTLKYAYRYSKSLCIKLFVCFGFFCPTPYGDVAINDERMQILTYTRHSWPFFSMNWNCDTGHPVITVISGDSSCQAFISGAVTTWFKDVCLSRLGFEHTTFRMWVERSNALTDCETAACLKKTICKHKRTKYLGICNEYKTWWYACLIIKIFCFVRARIICELFATSIFQIVNNTNRTSPYIHYIHNLRRLNIPIR